MKKLITLILCAALAVSLSACAPGPDDAYDYDAKAEDVGFSGSDLVSLEAEHEVYDGSIEQITFIITSFSSEELSYGEDYRLYMASGDKWREIYPGRLDVSFPAIACILPVGGRSAVTMPVHSLRPGIYRYVKTVSGVDCYAEFQIGQSQYSAKTPYGYVALSSLPSAYDAQTAESAGDVVFGAGDIKNSDSFEHFLDMVSLGAPAFARLTAYTVEGDPVVTDVEYNGRYFTLTTDSTRDKFGVQETSSAIYSYIVTNDSGVYLSNCVSYSAAGSCLYGLERGTVLLTPRANSEWCSTVSELSQRNVELSTTVMRVWSSDGSRACSVDSSGSFGYRSISYSSAESLPKEKYTGLGSAVSAAWIDDSTFLIAAENSSDPVFPYLFFVYDVTSDTSFSLSATYSGSGFSIGASGLIIQAEAGNG
jgi:hypothetical protein